MQVKRVVFSLIVLLIVSIANAQLLSSEDIFTKADTLRGSNNENRDWWDVMRYDLKVKPDFITKTIEGTCEIAFKVVKPGKLIQIDLQDSLQIDSISLITITSPLYKNHTLLSFIKKDGVYLITFPKTNIGNKETIRIHYHGKPKEAIKPPWDGGWVWQKDSLGNPWVSVSCQGLGASCWYPCKDLQSDEPDRGASLEVIIPDTLVCISNGREINTDINKVGTRKPETIGGLKHFKWEVMNPINNYDIIPYIGKYTNFTDTLMGEGGKLDLSYWVLPCNLDKAKKQFTQVKPMLHCFEHWFGKYPFYEDSYKLVEASYLGMEHQSAVAYGNGYKNGYKGSDLSKTGWGLKWDFIIVHESGHEWFGNSITSKDLADMWIHESFTMYSEVLYTQWMFGEEAANDYCLGLRQNIQNDKPIIGPYGVNKEGSGDMYYKGANMLHTIRHIINNDSLFREMLRGLNTTFYHQTVTTKQIEDYMISKSGFDLKPIFNQYLTTVSIPHLKVKINEKQATASLCWTNCSDDFIMPIVIPITSNTMKINTKNKIFNLSKEEMKWFTKENLERRYYIELE